MKIKVKAKELASAVKTILAVHDFGETSVDRQPCCLTASDDGLTLESSRLGAYIVKRIDGTLLRTGAVGLNAKDLAAMKLTGEVTIDASNGAVKFTTGRTAYRWATDLDAQHDVKDQRGAKVKIKPTAKLPVMLLRAGAKFATYKSEIQGDYDVQITLDKGYFEYYGHDHLSYGRYEFRDKTVRTKGRLCFMLGNSFLHKVMKELDTGDVTVGIAEDGSIVRLSGPDFDLFHPTVEKDFQNSADTIAAATEGDAKCLCRFLVKRNEIKGALDRVAPVSKKAPDATMLITVKKNGAVAIKQHAQEGAAVCRIETEKAQARRDVKITVRAQYLQEFIKVAPTTVPLMIESWDGIFLRIMVKEDPGMIDYLAMMVGE